MYFHAKAVSSMNKVFCRETLDAQELKEIGGAKGEVVSFQIACQCKEGQFVRLRLQSPLAEITEIREVQNIPSMNPGHPHDTFLLSHEAGLYPDALIPCPGWIKVSRCNHHAFWITVRIPENYQAGAYTMDFILDQQEMPLTWQPQKFEQKIQIALTVYDFTLPKQKLFSINWFYADCILSQYHLECWSEEHWAMLKKYFKNTLEHGNNVLLTPLWTVPLDTAVGHERPTAQLLTITESGGLYHIDFTLLKRWLDTARAIGFEYFEMAHLFTQWGAEFAPKIVVNGENRFGWHIRANSTEYRDFLRQILPQLCDFLCGEGLKGKCFFHLSDEPAENHLNAYREAAEFVRLFLEKGDFTILDALSNVRFFQEGLTDCPVPATSAIEAFMKEPIKKRWVYYCGNWENGLPNRSFGMPSTRNRIMGILLYLYKMDGFLHWGYNFWYTQYSLRTDVNPYLDPDANRSFLAGDSFNVYPGKDGPVDSLHFEVFREGFQDLRALQLLESKVGREETVRMIHEGLDYPISMTRYPRETEWIPELRKRVNEKIASC